MHSPICLLALLSVAVLPTAVHAGAPPIQRHDVRVSLEPVNAALTAVDRVRFAPSGTPDRDLPFLLHRDLEVSSVRLGGVDLVVESLERWRPRDFFARPDYAALGGFAIARQHVIAPPGGGWPTGEFEVEIMYAGAVYDSLRPPDVAYGRGFETTSGLIDPRGAYLTSESFWVPWTGEGRFHFRLETSLPEGWHSMSQGRRIGHDQQRGRNHTVWQTDAPQELIYLVAGPYTIRERSHEGVSLYTYTYADTPDELCQTYLDAAAAYLDRYGQQIAPYGFSKWAMVENWWQTGFGMPGFTLLGDRVIRLPFIVDTSYGHEILHCWWGNGVYVDEESGNWCEGLTAYQADYAYKLEESEAAARDYRRAALTGYLDFASSEARDFPLSEFRERSDFGTQAIGYGKCLMVFHMLAQSLPGGSFEAGLREFYRRFEFQPASWGDLADVFSEETGRDLHPWFDHWVQRTGAARISIESLERAAGTWRLVLAQSGEAFPLQVPVTWESGSGSGRAVVSLDGESAQLELPADLHSVAVDPDYDLFREVFREEVPPALSQVLGADSTTVVIGSAASEPMREALLAVARDWAANQDAVIVDEADFDPVRSGARNLFVLGPGPLAERSFAGAAGALGSAPLELKGEAEGKSLVACFRDPANADIARAIVLPASVEVAAALGRKIPHYSRYSWLLFEGEQNVGKGSWTVLTSPLRRTLEDSR